MVLLGKIIYWYSWFIEYTMIVMFQLTNYIYIYIIDVLLEIKNKINKVNFSFNNPN